MKKKKWNSLEENLTFDFENLVTRFFLDLFRDTGKDMVIL